MTAGKLFRWCWRCEVSWYEEAETCWVCGEGDAVHLTKPPVTLYVGLGAVASSP